MRRKEADGVHLLTTLRHFYTIAAFASIVGSSPDAAIGDDCGIYFDVASVCSTDETH